MESLTAILFHFTCCFLQDLLLQALLCAVFICVRNSWDWNQSVVLAETIILNADHRTAFPPLTLLVEDVMHFHRSRVKCYVRLILCEPDTGQFDDQKE